MIPKGVSMVKFEKKEFFLWPNIISLFRLLMAIPLYFSLILNTGDKFNYNTLVIVAIIFISDYLDGYLARKLNQITELGKLLDPLADKIAVLIVSLALLQIEKLPFYLFLSIILRDVLIFLGGIYITKKIGYILPSNIIGKLTVNILALYYIVLIFTDLSPKFFEVITFIFIILSFLVYTYRAIETVYNHNQESSE